MTKLITDRNRRKTAKKWGFTLPEVIISFSVLAMVVTSAVSVLSLVMRTNADNVSSLVANGLAQEGIEAVRFIRDSDVILGLDFDGGRENNNVILAWGGRLFDSNATEPKYFSLINKEDVQPHCLPALLQGCLPIELKELSDTDLVSLSESEETQIYLEKAEKGGAFRYFQNDGVLDDAVRTTAYHRVIRIEPLKVPETNPDINAIRVSSIVFWQGINNMPKKLVLTTELTDWR